MSELSNLRATARRHWTPGTFVILVIAAIAFGPRIWDTIRGEPWIDNQLMLAQNSGGALIVEDVTRSNAPVHGMRFTSAESADGTVICSADHSAIWHGEAKRFWRLNAFIGCETPSEAFKICSRFSVRSESGRRRSYGPFCSPLSQPPSEVPEASNATISARG